jgi:hypothetical protein
MTYIAKRKRTTRLQNEEGATDMVSRVRFA